jgi:hypothetical protein
VPEKPGCGRDLLDEAVQANRLVAQEEIVELGARRRQTRTSIAFEVGVDLVIEKLEVLAREQAFDDGSAVGAHDGIDRLPIVRSREAS